MKYSLALSGGGSRAFFHLGVVKYLEECGYEIEAISGSSGGAIVGAFLSKYSAQKSYELLSKIDYFKFMKFNYFRGGLFHLDRFDEILDTLLGCDRFEELDNRLYICATNLNSAKAKYFSSGELNKAILASCAITPIFAPQIIDGHTYIDGGYIDNLPITPLKNNDTKIIAINIYPKKETRKKYSIISTPFRTYEVMIYQNTYKDIDKCTHYLEDSSLVNYKILSKHNYEELYNKGYSFAQKYFENIRQKDI
jgi:NTE family protein